MNIDFKKVKQLIREELAINMLQEEAEKDVDYDLEKTGAKASPKTKAAMTKDGPAFFKADERIDQSGTPKEQAQMLAKFALDYADGVEGDAETILRLAFSKGVDSLVGDEKSSDPATEDAEAGEVKFESAKRTHRKIRRKLIERYVEKIF